MEGKMVGSGTYREQGMRLLMGYYRGSTLFGNATGSFEKPSEAVDYLSNARAFATRLRDLARRSSPGISSLFGWGTAACRQEQIRHLPIHKRGDFAISGARRARRRRVEQKLCDLIRHGSGGWVRRSRKTTNQRSHRDPESNGRSHYCSPWHSVVQGLE